MWGHIFSKFRIPYLSEYIQQILVFPLETCSRFLPASALISYYFVREKIITIKFNLGPLEILFG
jgi:hypothetical protein